MKDNITYNLSKGNIIFLIIVYSVLCIVGTFITIIIVCSMPNTLPMDIIIKYSFLISISISVALCSISYIRKIYKACIDNRVLSDGSSNKQLGNLVYFLTRPLFAIAFSVVMVLALLAGFFTVTGSLDYILNDRFVYLCAVLSAFIGFSVGKVLDRFIKTSNEYIESVR